MLHRRFLSLAFIAWAVLCVTGCGEFTTGVVYIDNGSPEPIEVLVDGKPVATIPSNHFEGVKLELGERHFQIRRGGVVVYNQSHILDYGDRPYRAPTYLLNPDHTKHYCMVSVRYGEDRYEAEQLAAMGRLYAKLEKCESDGDAAELAELQAKMQCRVAKEFKQVKWDLKPIENLAFIQFEDCSRVLVPIPAKEWVSGHSSGFERTIIVRVPKRVHEEVKSALSVEQPSLTDLARLFAAEQQALSYVRVEGRPRKVAAN